MTVVRRSRRTMANGWRGGGLGAVLYALASARDARAQSAPSLDARTWRPSPDPEAGLVLEPTASPCRWCGNVAVWLAYAQDPVTVRDGSTVAFRPVTNQLTADLTASLGLGARLALGIDAPFVVWQRGSAPSSGSGAATGAAEGAFGDLSASLKASLVSNDRHGIPSGFGLAAIGGLTLPTGNRASYLGEGAVTASLRALGEYALGPAVVRASVGFDLRPDWRAWSPDVAAAPVTFGDAVEWAVAIGLQPKAAWPALDEDDRQRWEVGAHGGLPAGPVAPFGVGAPGAAAESPVLLAVDDRVALGRARDVYLLAGVEVGLGSGLGVPLARAVLSFGWVPRVHDRDADGVPDDVDQCPDLAEDRDGIQDADGCPEDDADGDDIPDDQDACPLAAGPPSGDRRKNGCPSASSPSPPAPASRPKGRAP